MIYRHRIKCVLTPSRRQSEPALKEKQYQQQKEQREHHQKFLRSDTVDTLPMKDAPSPSSSSTSSTAEEEENLMHQQHEERVVAVQEENTRLVKQVQVAQETIEQLRQELMLANRNQYEAEEKCRQYKEVLLQDLHAEEEEEEEDKENNDQEGEVNLRNSNRSRREKLALMLLQEEKEDDAGHPIAVAWTAAALTFGIAFYVFC